MDLMDRTVAAAYDPLMRSTERAGLGVKRRELLAGLHGHVVEIGAGTGANLPHVPPSVDLLTLLEPSPAMAGRLRAGITRAAVTVAAGNVEVLEAPAEAIPLPDAVAEAVVSTLVLCSVEDLGRALAEIRRVLRPGGQLILVEHVATDGALGTWQRLLAPAWQSVARGCHLRRDTRTAVAGAGFDVRGITTWRLPGGGPAAPAIAGVARRA